MLEARNLSGHLEIDPDGNDGEQGDGDPTFPLPGPHGLPPGAQRVAAETWRITRVGEG